jgi:hypothetical protein
MQPRLFLSREQIPGTPVTALFALFVIILPRSPRGIPGLILFLLFLSIPIYIAMSHSAFEYESEIARLSLLCICLNYAIGSLGEDHSEGKSATMFVAVFVALLLARLSRYDSGQPRGSPT